MACAVCVSSPVCADRMRFAIPHFVVNVHDSHRSKLYGLEFWPYAASCISNYFFLLWILMRFAESLHDWITVAFTLQTYFSFAVMDGVCLFFFPP